MVKKVLNFRVIIEKEKYPGGLSVYTAFCPTLGVADYGDTVEEVLRSIKDGIKLAVDCLVKEKREVPYDAVEEQLLASVKVSLAK